MTMSISGAVWPQFATQVFDGGGSISLFGGEGEGWQ